ncbi:hypothetical protein INR99_01190 [Chitinilyticum litopenaei]|uniref:Uncharacterized protein n=2 Tax=Chitinilyticum piscinae TaxID=2866724 RepID=A0A8J7FKS4_9NEIS|nr:hypothetical protein [Chitinilyticum piscinae]
MNHQEKTMPETIRRYIDSRMAGSASTLEIIEGISHEFHIPARTAYEMLQEYLLLQRPRCL